MADSVVNYVVVAVFVTLFVGWKIIKRTKVVPLLQVDLVTGKKPYEAFEPESDTRQVAWYVKVKRGIFG